MSIVSLDSGGYKIYLSASVVNLSVSRTKALHNPFARCNFTSLIMRCDFNDNLIKGYIW